MEPIQQSGITRQTSISGNFSEPAITFDQFKSNINDLIYLGVRDSYSRDYVAQSLLDMAVKYPEHASQLGIPEDFKLIKQNIVEPAYQNTSLEEQNTLASREKRKQLIDSPWRINYGTHASWSVGIGGEVNAGASMGLGNASGGGFYATYGGMTGLDIGVGGTISITKGSIAAPSNNYNISLGGVISFGISLMYDTKSDQFCGSTLGIFMGPLAGVNMSRSSTSGCEATIYPIEFDCYK